MKSAAKLLHQTAKTCQYVRKNALFCEKVHFFCLRDAAEPLLFRVLEVDGVFLAQVFDHFGWEEFGGRKDAIGFEKGAVGSQPSAKSFRTDTRRIC